MFVYKDYNYVKYVCSLDINAGLDLYSKCLSRLQDIENEKVEEKLWDMYKNRDSGENITFEEFKNSQMKLSKIDNKDKDLEEERIIKENFNIINIDQRREVKDVNRKRVSKIIKR